MSTYVVDEYMLTSGSLSDEETLKKLKDSVILIPEGIIKFMEVRANKGDKKALGALYQALKLREHAPKFGIEVKIVKHLEKGSKALEEIAKKHNAKVLTSNSVRWLALRVRGVPTSFLGTDEWRPVLEEFFQEGIMSIHLKEGVPPMAKKGRPGHFRLIKLREKPMGRDELMKLAHALIEGARLDPEVFVEIQRRDAYVIQLGEYRVLVAFPPFSDGVEITAVRPIVKVTLDDYELSSKLKKRLRERAEGIVIGGPPGAGKTTFTSALAEFYKNLGKIVKSLESPRDLQVGDEITQYTKLDGSFENAADLLLLVRPDYVCFDEMRKDEDFKIYTDMRLAGIGMVGVIHCGSPIEAIERFIGRVDLGMLPHVVDTVIFIEEGKIKKVYSLSITVKVPHGMREEGLARPVVLVKDFESGQPEYEIYSFAEQVVVMPLKRRRPPSIEIKGFPSGEEIYDFTVKEGRKSVILEFGERGANRSVSLYDGDIEIATVKLGPMGRTAIGKRRKVGRQILRAWRAGTLRAFFL